MADKYKEFAEQTYKTFYSKIESALKNSNSAIIIIGEEHTDTPLEIATNHNTHTDDQEPAIASAFSHISAMESAARLAGHENVIFSIELTQDILASTINKIEKNDGKVPETLRNWPSIHAIAYALEKEIKIAATDPLGLDNKELFDDEREQFQIDAISALARQDSSKQIVIHIGGTAHLSNLSGYTDEEILKTNGTIEADPTRNPFRGIYDQTLLFNTTRLPETLKQEMIKIDNNIETRSALAEYNYAANPENAIQIDAPGMIDYQTIGKIADLVQAAANKHQSGQEPIKEEAPSTPKTEALSPPL